MRALLQVLILAVLLPVFERSAAARSSYYEQRSLAEELANNINKSGPSLIGLVSEEGLIGWAAQSGTGKGALSASPDLDTRWVAPGMSRVVTALAAGALVSRGMLSLDQRIPEALGVRADPDMDTVTVGDLVGGEVLLRTPQRSLALDRSICCWANDRLRRQGALQEEPTRARRRLASAVLRKELVHERKSPDWMAALYTHPQEMSALVLAAIMEHRSGSSWETLVQNLVLSPLGLGRLRHGPGEDGPVGLVFRIHPLEPLIEGGRWVRVRRDPGAFRPAGGLALSAQQMAGLVAEISSEHPRLPIDVATRARVLHGEGERPGALLNYGRHGLSLASYANGRLDGFWDTVMVLSPVERAPGGPAAAFLLGTGSNSQALDVVRDALFSRARPDMLTRTR